MKITGMAVVSLRGRNCGVWSLLDFQGGKPIFVPVYIKLSVKKFLHVNKNNKRRQTLLE